MTLDAVGVLSLEEPPSGSCCPDCGEPLRIVAYCGACAEHDRRRDDPLRLVETQTILDLSEARRRTRAHLATRQS